MTTLFVLGVVAVAFMLQTASKNGTFPIVISVSGLSLLSGKLTTTTLSSHIIRNKRYNKLFNFVTLGTNGAKSSSSVLSLSCYNQNHRRFTLKDAHRGDKPYNYHFLLSMSVWGASNVNNPEQSNDEERYRKHLESSQKQEYNRFVQNDVPSWLRENDLTYLPFNCTACGKCCQIVGSVSMDPNEIKQASRLLNITVVDFVQTYSSEIITVTNRSTVLSSPITQLGSVVRNQNQQQVIFNNSINADYSRTWIRLKEKHFDATSAKDLPASYIPTDSDETTKQNHSSFSFSSPTPTIATTTCCIFLNTSTKQCQIYEARPIHCRTYPFWTNILKNVDSWNDECRSSNSTSTVGLIDDDVCNTVSELSQPPLWSPELGGCEGMKRIGSESPPLKSSSDDGVVLIDEVYQQLYAYQKSKERFPI